MKDILYEVLIFNKIISTNICDFLIQICNKLKKPCLSFLITTIS